MKDLLDLDRFPLDRPGTPDWQALVARCQADLEAEGMFNLDGLMHPERAAEIAQTLLPRFDSDSFTHERKHNVYFLKSVPGLPEDHPALTLFQTSNRTLCADQVEDCALMALYRWPPFVQFLAACMETPQLFVMPDPLACVNVMSYHEGQALNWHFDRSEFTTTLLLQAPEQGGAFEYRSDLRTEDDPNYDGVAALLQGQDKELRQISVVPGTVNVFKGRNTAHRVTPVKGPSNRVIAVFSYYEQPDVMFSDEERIGFFGRAS